MESQKVSHGFSPKENCHLVDDIAVKRDKLSTADKALRHITFALV
jgi:hypothetical protein